MDRVSRALARKIRIGLLILAGVLALLTFVLLLVYIWGGVDKRWEATAQLFGVSGFFTFIVAGFTSLIEGDL